MKLIWQCNAQTINFHPKATVHNTSLYIKVMYHDLHHLFPPFRWIQNKVVLSKLPRIDQIKIIREGQ
jgi:hypothetical protein